VMRKIAGYLTKNRSGKDKKSPKAHTKTNTLRQEYFLEKFKTVS